MDAQKKSNQRTVKFQQSTPNAKYSCRAQLFLNDDIRTRVLTNFFPHSCTIRFI